MTRGMDPNDPRPRRAPFLPGLALLAALSLALAGCTAGSDDPTDSLGDLASGDRPTLYLNVTAGDQTYRFTSDSLGGGGDGDDSGGGSANATLTESSGTVTAQGNASAGNGTAGGNGTASNGTVSGNAGGTGGDGTGSGGFPPGIPSGDAPLNVTVQIGASGLPDDVDLSALNWTVRWGDAASTSGGNASAQASGNGTAAVQQAQESGSSLPATLRHTYTTPGQHRMSFGLAAAKQSLGTVGTLVAVGEGVPQFAPGTLLGQVPFNATGDLPAANPVTDCDPEGGESFPWTFADQLNGTPAEVSELNLSLASSGTVYDVDLFLFAPNGTEIGSAEGSGADKVLELAGPFAPGEYVVRVVACVSGGGEFVLEGAATYVAAAAGASRAST
jgi:hypothetical protein